jgi:peptidyl-prolyl cis-trans isomerase C
VSGRAWRSWLPVLLILLVGGAATTAPSAAADRGRDEIARVNGVVITRRQFQIEYRLAVDRHAREGRPVNEAHLAPVRRAVMRQMIEEELLFQESRRLGIVVTTKEIDAAVAAARARFKDDAAFEKELARRDMDDTRYRRKLHRQHAIDRLISRQLMPSISVAEEDVRRFYEANPQRFQTPEKIRLGHIFIPSAPGTEPGQDASARRKIETIADKLAQGGDFEMLAQQYSQEPQRGQADDRGYVERGRLTPEIEAVAFDLKVGETSPIVTTRHGFHLIRVTDRKPARVIPFAEARAGIRETLIQLKRERAVQDYVDALRRTAEIHSAY